MSKLELPIVIAEGLDISAFQSIEDAERCLEPWWVAERRGRVYDSRGRLISLEASATKVRIRSWEDEPTHATELERLLREYFRMMGDHEADDSDCSLSCLVDKLVNSSLDIPDRK